MGEEVDQLVPAIDERRVELLFDDAGRGLGDAFLQKDLDRRRARGSPLFFNR